MATAKGITPGTPIGIREAARKYRIDHSLLSRWAKGGKISTVLDGKLDESSLLAALAQYRPHRDNQVRNGKPTPKKATKAQKGPEPPLRPCSPTVFETASSTNRTLPFGWGSGN